MSLSHNSLLVINPKGHIREIYCPFRVQCIKPVITIPAGTWVYVEEIGVSTIGILLYRINGNWYSFECFAIVIYF